MSGPSEDYDLGDEAEIEAALDRAWHDYDGDDEDQDDDQAEGTPTEITIRAEIEWAGVKTRSDNGMRTTTLVGLELSGVRDALTAARRASSAAKTAGTGFRAKEWEGQLKTLMDHRFGHSASDRAGLTVTAKTLRTWVAGDSDPTPANQRKIADAYANVRNDVANEARGRADRARHALADALSEAVADAYGGAEVRFRNIQSLDLGD